MNNNKIDVVALRKSVEKLPYWLRHAANRIEETALKSGEKSVLALKLNWYADKIEKVTVNPSGASPQADLFIEKHLVRVKELQAHYAKVHEDVVSAGPQPAGASLFLLTPKQ